jgi:hypothetical protein
VLQSVGTVSAHRAPKSLTQVDAGPVLARSTRLACMV